MTRKASDPRHLKEGCRCALEIGRCSTKCHFLQLKTGYIIDLQIGLLTQKIQGKKGKRYKNISNREICLGISTKKYEYLRLNTTADCPLAMIKIKKVHCGENVCLNVI